MSPKVTLDQGANRVRQRVAFLDDGSKCGEGIASALHGCRSGVTGFPLDDHVVPANPLNAGHYADLQALLLKDRALLDVHFEGPASMGIGCGSVSCP